jgi:outer membrane lipoprotein SlyB
MRVSNGIYRAATIFAAAALVLAAGPAAAETPRAEAGCYGEKLGAVVGGATGALIGSRIGKGDGKPIAIVAGAALGTLAGAAIGRAVDESDERCAAPSLGYEPGPRTLAWRDGR